ncbi:MAG: 4-(cytidine 5'-diphospho)-2-C-methyl-D-erythritol kinase [Pseudomonadota bacterium]
MKSAQTLGPLAAPAKINWFLNIVGRRDDGYHELQSAFQFLTLADRLQFAPRDDGEIRRLPDIAGIPERDDLVVKAAWALRHASGTDRGVTITVDKRIPTGAGLGGGSSDAATTLVALNALWDLGIDSERLATIGLTLGADVPIFLFGRSAWAEGIGERLVPVRLPEVWLVVIYPDQSIPTRDIFTASKLTRNSAPRTIPRFLRESESGPLRPADVLAVANNDCEVVARHLYPVVGEALEWLGQYGTARMTGTGSAIFCAFGSYREAVDVAAQVPARWQGFVTQTRNRSATVTHDPD